MKIRACHSHSAYNPEKVDEIVKAAREKLASIEFDAFAFSGFSGALIAPILARELKKTLLHVRKAADLEGASHAYEVLEGDFDAKKYIIVDDFIHGGSTVSYIQSTINSQWKYAWMTRFGHLPAPECVAVALYQSEYSRKIPGDHRIIFLGD